LVVRAFFGAVSAAGVAVAVAGALRVRWGRGVVVPAAAVDDIAVGATRTKKKSDAAERCFFTWDENDKGCEKDYDRCFFDVFDRKR